MLVALSLELFLIQNRQLKHALMDEYSKPLLEDWEGIVIHSASEFINKKPIRDFLESIKVSAHYFVRPKGVVKQMVPLYRQAKHAGVSRWKGMSNLNKNFIGIEILVEGDNTYEEFLRKIKRPETFTAEQYESTAILCYSMMSKFPTISMDNIVMHSEVSGPDIRPDDPKYDPGEGFDMDLLKSKIKYFTA